MSLTKLSDFKNKYLVNYEEKYINYNGYRILDDTLIEVLKEIGGKSFNNGLYRICNGNLIDKYTSLAEDYFPKLKNSIVVFGFDWLGRFFANETSTNEILLIEPGAGDALEIPVNIIEFHNKILIDNSNEALAEQFYYEWYKKEKTIIKYTECVGYQVPLFLSGIDEVVNMSLIEIEIYFEICAQLWNKTKSLKTGQKICNIVIN